MFPTTSNQRLFSDEDSILKDKAIALYQLCYLIASLRFQAKLLRTNPDQKVLKFHTQFEKVYDELLTILIGNEQKRNFKVDFKNLFSHIDDTFLGERAVRAMTDFLNTCEDIDTKLTSALYRLYKVAELADLRERLSGSGSYESPAAIATKNSLQFYPLAYFNLQFNDADPEYSFLTARDLFCHLTGRTSFPTDLTHIDDDASLGINRVNFLLLEDNLVQLSLLTRTDLNIKRPPIFGLTGVFGENAYNLMCQAPSDRELKEFKGILTRTEHLVLSLYRHLELSGYHSKAIQLKNLWRMHQETLLRSSKALTGKSFILAATLDGFIPANPYKTRNLGQLIVDSVISIFGAVNKTILLFYMLLSGIDIAIFLPVIFYPHNDFDGACDAVEYQNSPLCKNDFKCFGPSPDCESSETIWKQLNQSALSSKQENFADNSIIGVNLGIALASILLVNLIAIMKALLYRQIYRMPTAFTLKEILIKGSMKSLSYGFEFSILISNAFFMRYALGNMISVHTPHDIDWIREKEHKGVMVQYIDESILNQSEFNGTYMLNSFLFGITLILALRHLFLLCHWIASELAEVIPKVPEKIRDWRQVSQYSVGDLLSAFTGNFSRVSRKPLNVQNDALYDGAKAKFNQKL